MSPPSRLICIVGAPRSGTTSLAGFLQEHPSVCFSLVKEPHYFSRTDFTGVPLERLKAFVEADYLERFFPHRDEAAVLAEGSVSYLYAPERLDAMLRLWPDVRFIVAVRDPLEMLPSLHRRLLYTGDETIADFEHAWALMPARMQGLSIPRSCIDARMLQYEQVGRLGSHLERLFGTVGRERCFVSVFDDLAADPAGVYQRMLDFLDLPPHERNDFAPRRVSTSVRSGWLQRLLKRPPIATQVLAGEKFRHRVRRLDRRRESGALVQAIFAGRKKLLRWNRRPAPPASLSQGLKEEIQLRLAEDVALLSRLIDRDLGHWLDGASATLVDRRAWVSQPRREDLGRLPRPAQAV